MSEFTYQQTPTGTALESMEWDNVWWHSPEDTEHKRVLYIGDSISCRVRGLATKKAKESIYFDGFGTSKALDNPFFKTSLSIFGKQQGRRDGLLFNNGLHGWHLSDDAYAYHYEEMVKYLMEEFAPAKLVLLLTTSLAAPQSQQRQKTVKARNSRVMQIAKKYNLQVIDVYSLSVEKTALHHTDGVHFTEAGYEALAEKIVEDIRKLLDA